MVKSVDSLPFLANHFFLCRLSMYKIKRNAISTFAGSLLSNDELTSGTPS